jgi:hypothetical protein
VQPLRLQNGNEQVPLDTTFTKEAPSALRPQTAQPGYMAMTTAARVRRAAAEPIRRASKVCHLLKGNSVTGEG